MQAVEHVPREWLCGGLEVVVEVEVDMQVGLECKLVPSLLDESQRPDRLTKNAARAHAHEHAAARSVDRSLPFARTQIVRPALPARPVLIISSSPRLAAV